MATQTGHANASKVRKTKVALAAEEEATHYQSFIPHAAKEAMQPLEDKAKPTRAYREDANVDEQLGVIVSDLGCTRNIDTKFHHTVELY
jgi:hypothetical protein